MSKNNRKRFS